jgi:putative addiction module component (TIGR02574 family)
MTTAEILPEILRMSPEDKRVIAEALRQDLGELEPVDRAEFDRELERRVADADAHPEEMIPWEEALRQLRGKR